MVDGVGMFVSSIGDRISSMDRRDMFVGVITFAVNDQSGSPLVKVQVGGGDETPLRWVSTAVQSLISTSSVVGREIQIVSNQGQWAGLEILTPCRKA